MDSRSIPMFARKTVGPKIRFENNTKDVRMIRGYRLFDGEEIFSYYWLSQPIIMVPQEVLDMSNWFPGFLYGLRIQLFGEPPVPEPVDWRNDGF